ncbi:F-box protein [Criblamydia sequanensis]|uniref:F-box domain-containing protein n=1 Tax=Candidatus Criblamydia sequanensis CRIB-18 TaxID=1437425 RepID=A0A090CZG4_9BACT|nr:F-box protein [Criblamydia sequanensis]CDR34266.1 F-box domain-containing protein [Criblamydia sequanensis CRIB-18]
MEVKGNYHLPASLPDEVMLAVFQYLPPSTLCKAGLVSKKWQSLHGDDWLWSQFFKAAGSTNRKTSKKELCKRLFKEFKKMQEVSSELYLLTQMEAVQSVFLHSELRVKLESHINGLLNECRFHHSYLAVDKDPNFISHFESLYYSESQENRLKLAIKSAEFDPSISLHIEKFDLDEDNRLKVCLQAIRIFSNEIAKHIRTFKFSEENRLTVALRLASVNPIALIENFHNFKIKDEKNRATVACEAAKHNPRIVTLHISNLYLLDVELRKAVAKEALRADFKNIRPLLHLYNIPDAKKFAEEVKKSLKTGFGKKVKKFLHI